jgi:hypothetical protein
VGSSLVVVRLLQVILHFQQVGSLPSRCCSLSLFVLLLLSEYGDVYCSSLSVMSG